MFCIFEAIAYGDNSFYCWMAGVNPEFKWKGVLKAMMSYLENWVKEKGYSKISIKTRNRRREIKYQRMINGAGLINTLYM